MVIRLEIKLVRVTQSLFTLMDNVHRLCNNKKSFIFRFKRGNRLYLDTCMGLQNEYYVCVKDLSDINLHVATLNYALALNAQFNLSLDNKILYFDISSNDDTDDAIDTMKKITLFADSINVPYALI